MSGQVGVVTLEYGKKGRRVWWGVIRLVVLGLACAYVGVWVKIAERAPEGWMLDDHTEYWWREPEYGGWRREASVVFAPARWADERLRPWYWSGSRELNETYMLLQLPGATRSGKATVLWPEGTGSEHVRAQ